jgi:hypothetical protein
MLQLEHGGMEETLANIYVLTGDKKYLDAAHRFHHEAIMRPLLEGRDDLAGRHANTQIPKNIAKPGSTKSPEMQTGARSPRRFGIGWSTAILTSSAATAKVSTLASPTSYPSAWGPILPRPATPIICSS